jgi:hypothetical protein
MNSAELKKLRISVGQNSNLFVIVLFVFPCQMSTLYQVNMGIKKLLLIMECVPIIQIFELESPS